MAVKAPVVSNKNVKNTADLLDQLSDLVPTTKKPKAGAKENWDLVLNAEQTLTFNRWIEAKCVSEIVDTRLDSSKDELCEFALDIVCKKLWDSKVRPLNPVLTVKVGNTVDSHAKFLFTDKFKYRFPEIPDDANARDFFVQIFVDLGLEQADAENLVDDELDLNPIVGIRPLTELLNGHYGEKRQFIDSSDAEKEAGRKLMQMLKAQPDADGMCQVEVLTAEERGLLIRRENGIKVKSEFYSRVCLYCHSVEQLKAIFKVIVPIAYPTQQKFAINEVPDKRATRLVQAAANIIGVNLAE